MHQGNNNQEIANIIEELNRLKETINEIDQNAILDLKYINNTLDYLKRNNNILTKNLDELSAFNEQISTLNILLSAFRVMELQKKIENVNDIKKIDSILGTCTKKLSALKDQIDLEIKRLKETKQHVTIGNSNENSTNINQSVPEKSKNSDVEILAESAVNSTDNEIKDEGAKETLEALESQVKAKPSNDPVNEFNKTNELHKEQTNKDQAPTFNVMKGTKIIVGSMLAGAFFGASLASTFASYISPSFAIPAIGQFIGAGALGLIVAATIIGAAAGFIAGAVAAYKEYQGSKSGKYNTSTIVKDTSNSQNQPNNIVAEFVTI